MPQTFRHTITKAVRTIDGNEVERLAGDPLWERIADEPADEPADKRADKAPETTPSASVDRTP